jgi:hypothetical protein
MFAVLRICRVLSGQNLVPQHFWIAHYRSGVFKAPDVATDERTSSDRQVRAN